MNDKDAAAQVNDALDKTKNELKLDYTLQDPGARNELVKKIIEQTPPQRLTPKYLQLLSDYLVFAMDKEERKEFRKEHPYEVFSKDGDFLELEKSRGKRNKN